MARLFLRAAALLVAAVLMVGCGLHEHSRSKTPKKDVNRPTFTLFVDKGFSGPERELIVDGFKQWERDTRGTVKFDVTTYPFDSSTDEVPEGEAGKCTYDTYVVRMPETAKVVKKLDERFKPKGHTLGFTQSNCKMRVVALITSRLRDAKLFRQVVVHEAGHLIGLDHIPVPKESVMFPSTDKATKCPTALDMKQLCMLYDCDWRDMAACE